MNRQTDGKYVVIHTRRGQAMPLMGCKIHSSVSTRTVNIKHLSSDGCFCYFIGATKVGNSKTLHQY